MLHFSIITNSIIRLKKNNRKNVWTCFKTSWGFIGDASQFSGRQIYINDFKPSEISRFVILSKGGRGGTIWHFFV